MMNKYLYGLEEADEFVGISATELYREVYEGGINYQFDDEFEYQIDTDGLRFHWSDLVKLKISLKGKKGQFSANFGRQKAAKYLGISVNELNCFAKLGLVKPTILDNGRKAYFEDDLNRFLVEILAPLSKVVELREV